MKPKFKIGQSVVIQRAFPALSNLVLNWGYIPNLSIVRIVEALPTKHDVTYRVQCADETIRYIDEFFLGDTQLELI